MNTSSNSPSLPKVHKLPRAAKNSTRRKSVMCSVSDHPTASKQESGRPRKKCYSYATWVVDGYHLCQLHAGLVVLHALVVPVDSNATTETPDA